MKTMTQAIHGFVLALGLTLAGPGQLSAQDSSGGEWVDLVTGNHLDGWKFHLGKSGTNNDGTFTAQDGTLICSGKPAGYLYTEKSYQNYVLQYDWAFKRPAGLTDDAAFRGNSGCLIHVGQKNVLGVWPLSIEVQGMHREAGRILPIPRSVKCTHTNHTQARAEVLNPVGEWNTTQVDVNRGNMTISLNGKIVSTVRDCELTQGPIAFQSEGAEIHYKNIRIRER